MAPRRCVHPNCRRYVTGQPRCAEHTDTDRGYGWAHQQLRANLAPTVDAGLTDCARCGQPITPGEPWDLGHHDTDRTRYNGPEHADCNRGRRPRQGEGGSNP